jgi:hypothetical protein
MRTLLLLVALGAGAAVAAGPTKRVDLDQPGRLDSLAVENPAHHRKALEYIRAAEKLPCTWAPKTQEAHYDPSKCSGALLLTSFPPKRRLAFVLDDTRYVAVVTLTEPGPRLMPAR